MVYSITNEDLIIVDGGHVRAGLGSQRHYPIFKDDAGVEYISLNGLRLQKISTVDVGLYSRREAVQRS
jgi:hypothetical protein